MKTINWVKNSTGYSNCKTIP